jgi:serine/threonine-protein kinase RsbT
VNDLEARISSVLRRYMPALLAESVRHRAQTSIDIPASALTAENLPQFADALTPGLALFVPPGARLKLMAEIRQLASMPSVPEQERIAIDTEVDISRARRRAYQLAIDLGASSFASQRVATVTSELARNIFGYAGKGYIDLVPRIARAEHLFTVRATDKGAGIANLEAILSGNYRSRTGLGRGLLAIKRLAKRFEVQTSSRGTTIEADIPF